MDAAARAGRHAWALLLGNFVIGTGVMVVPGTLNDISIRWACRWPRRAS
jgi:DHA1 family inner membrane transport protein